MVAMAVGVGRGLNFLGFVIGNGGWLLQFSLKREE